MCFCIIVPVVISFAKVDSTKRIIRIAHSQPVTHPQHKAILEFEKYVEDRLGDKYDVQVFPSELLGSAQRIIELCQTGAIDYIIVSAANLDSFSDYYDLFSCPYLFYSRNAYKEFMSNEEFLKNNLYNTSDNLGFEAVTWFDAGSRNFYADFPIYSLKDINGKKIRVQQNPTSVRAVEALGAAPVAMSFGEVYTAIQQNVIDGAENNELALTVNKHGEVAHYYSYSEHQMIPDLLLANLRFLDSLEQEEHAIFDQAVKVANQYELSEYDKATEYAINTSTNEMRDKFLKIDKQQFIEASKKVKDEMLESNPMVLNLYEFIQAINAKYESAQVG
ncbi:MAG: DctP family TRAP transporter solute-binding subunit [Eggerthellaceae bacterium]|nr:DctP family TRAP transporter solute-binding subunit [Eggerthellaceae bacterium]